MLRLDEARGRGLPPTRTGCGKSQTSAPDRPAPARGRPARRARPAPDALRRPRGDARPALRHARRHRRRRARRSRSARSTRSRSGWAWSCTPASTTRRSCAARRRRPTSSSGTAATTTSPSSRPTSSIVVADPLRPGHELLYHPGETNLRMADVVVVNKVDSAERAQRRAGDRERRGGQPDGDASSSPSRRRCSTRAPTSQASACWSSTTGRRSPTAGCRSAPASSRRARPAPRSVIDPRPYAVGSIREAFERCPQLTSVLPAMGYSRRAARRARADDQRRRLRRRRQRHPDRPRPPDLVAAPDPPRALRVARGGGAHAAEDAAADHRPGPRRPDGPARGE